MILFSYTFMTLSKGSTNFIKISAFLQLFNELIQREYQLFICIFNIRTESIFCIVSMQIIKFLVAFISFQPYIIIKADFAYFFCKYQTEYANSILPKNICSSHRQFNFKWYSGYHRADKWKCDHTENINLNFHLLPIVRWNKLDIE